MTSQNLLIKSFVRRGRITESQKRSLAQLKNRFLLPQEEVFNADKAFTCQAPLLLEIGFGMGENLVHMAQQRSEWNLLGVEVHSPGIGKVMNTLARESITNTRLYKNDIIEVLQKNVISEVIDLCCIFFPDPWSKTRHHKRRLIQKAFVDLLWSRMLPKSILWIATDWPHYATHIVELMNADERWSRVDFSTVDFSRVTTKFEAKGQRKGHSITDLLWQKNDNDLIST